MSSVTKRITEIKQPRGGYLKLSQFDVYEYDDGKILHEKENIHATLVGLTVDYLTRFVMGSDIVEAFRISCMGAKIAEQMRGKKDIKTIVKLLQGVKGLDDKSIINACKIVTYDVWYRNPFGAMLAKGVDEINPDKETIENIKVMVERSIQFWDDYGPIIKDGFTFEPNGYTQTVNAGDGDYLTEDTLWDFKVSKAKPSSKYTLQLLMYWIMGRHSGQKIYANIHKLGIFNPRLNIVYIYDANSISQSVIEEVEKEVICY